MNKNLKQQILELHQQGLSYNEIAKILNCSKSTISYHVGDGQKEKTLERQRIQRESDKLSRKMDSFKYLSRKIRRQTERKAIEFKYRGQPEDSRSKPFTALDIIKKYEGTCYLTGRILDLENSGSFHFDHIIPRSKGGDNSFENCGLTCRAANIAKSNLDLEEFFQLCVDVVKHNKLL